MKPLKVLINREPREGPWGGGAHFVNAFHKHAKANGVEIVKTLDESPDVIFIFHPEPELSQSGFDKPVPLNNGLHALAGTIHIRGISFQDAVEYRKSHPNTKILIRVNECDARKNTSGVDDIWRAMSSHASHTIFVSNWMKKYFEMGWRCYSNEVIINGVDRDKFEKREKISKTNGKINIVCAHWSDNRLKGQDVYEFLDGFVSKHTDYTFTYIGRTKAKLPNSTILPPLDPIELVKKLSEFDVCVNGTFWDPGPNAVIESIVAGLPTYVHNQSGGAADFAGQDHVFKTAEELEKILLLKQFPPNQDIFPDWESVMVQVFERIKSL
jgi:hypothetical protein